ncbi:MAG: adenosylcobinamide-phosphate synthase CbiB [Bacillota bacterium]
MQYIILVGAVLIDLVIGDPELIPHPVVLMGKLISFLENFFTGKDKGKNECKKKWKLFLTGIIIVFLTISITYLFTYLIINIGYKINFYSGFLIHLWLTATVLAIKGLKDSGLIVYKLLNENKIKQAKIAVGRIVGRDTDKMEEEDIIRGVVETIAENTSDGIIAPVFYYLIGGVPLAMAYKAVNTLDSMLGYKNKRYLYLGRAAARLDDLVNFIPARLTGLGFILAAFVTGNDSWRSLKTMLNDADNHPSWNAGYPEAAAAGALGIRLGGLNYYNSKPEFRPYMGKKEKNIENGDIIKIIKMMFWNTSIVFLILVFTFWIFRSSYYNLLKFIIKSF